MLQAAAQTCPIEALNAKARAEGWTFSCEKAVRFDAPQLNAILALWQSRAIGGRLPARSEFSARDLKSVLPNMMLCDLVKTGAANRFYYRYVGTAVARTMGEMTGKFMDEVLPPHVLVRTAPAYQTMADARIPLRFVTRFSMDKINFLAAEFFAAPLARDGVNPDMLMTVSYFRVP